MVAGGVRRHQSRNVRARLAAVRRARGEGPDPILEEEEGEDTGRVEELTEELVEREEVKVGGKVGTKKLRRIQEKAERKAMREVCRKGWLSVYVCEDALL